MSEEDKIFPQACPICNVETNYIYSITDGKDKSVWYKCPCGVIFQKDKPSNDVYDEKYVAGYAGFKESEAIQIHAARIYAPLIEETTYGRKMLDVGFNLPHNMNYFKERGWIVNGLEINKTFENKENIFVGDFENYEKFTQKYDLIWMSHVFEHFLDPIKALSKCCNLLSPYGVIYIATPDIDFIYKTGVASYPHWKAKEHFIMWTERALTRELEKLNFNIIVKRRNFCSRFSSWYDCQVLAQKQYY